MWVNSWHYKIKVSQNDLGWLERKFWDTVVAYLEAMLSFSEKYSEKATKFCKISLVDLTVILNRANLRWWFPKSFVYVSQNLNFTVSKHFSAASCKNYIILVSMWQTNSRPLLFCHSFSVCEFAVQRGPVSIPVQWITPSIQPKNF